METEAVGQYLFPKGTLEQAFARDYDNQTKVTATELITDALYKVKQYGCVVIMLDSSLPCYALQRFFTNTSGREYDIAWGKYRLIVYDTAADRLTCQMYGYT